MTRRRRKLPLFRVFLLTLLLVASGVMVYYIYGSAKISGESYEGGEEDLPVAINHLLSNELSDLQETIKFDQQIERFISSWDVKGLSLAGMKDEKLIYAKGYGWADKERGVKMDVNHIMRIASVSKLITAAAIMKLNEEGRLRLSDKPFSVGGILDIPQLQKIRDKRVRNITIEHLLRHKGGFTLRGGDPLFCTHDIKKRMKLERIPTPDDVIAYSLDRGLGFTPGTGTRYSNLGYLILTRIIEVISGENYEDYIKSEILRPAGIFDMHLGSNFYEEKLDNEVKYYEPENQEPVPSFKDGTTLCSRCYGGNNIEGLKGAGGWIASPTELLKLVASLDGKPGIGDILSPQSIELMTISAPGILPAGWSKINSNGDWSRTGTLSGSSSLIKNQKDGYAWVVLTNTSSWNGARFPKEIDHLFRKAVQKVSLWPQRNLFEFSGQLQRGTDHR